MNRLKHKADFIRILKNYKISDEGLKLLGSLRMVILAGPSATGRNSIIKGLVAKGGYHQIISDTTRDPRINDGTLEQNGVDYWFRNEADMLSDLKQGKFLEAEVIHNQQISGISLRELNIAVKNHKIAVTDMEIGGFRNVISLKPDVIAVLALPPSFSEWLDRIHKRGNMPTAEIRNRLNTGLRIFKDTLNNLDAKIVVNDQLDRAISEVDSLTRGAKDTNIESKINLLKTLLKQTEKYLEER